MPLSMKSKRHIADWIHRSLKYKDCGDIIDPIRTSINPAERTFYTGFHNWTMKKVKCENIKTSRKQPLRCDKLIGNGVPSWVKTMNRLEIWFDNIWMSSDC